MRRAVRMLLLIPTACGPDDARSGSVFHNAELQAMYEADQADRTAGPDIDWPVVSARDSARRVRAGQLLDSGLVTTAQDYYHAAMIFQHGPFGDTASAKRAFDLMERALALDSTVERGKWLRAAAWDRYLMYKGEPQWYGTQFRRPSPNAPWELWTVDTTSVTDRERAANGVPGLADARARAEAMNR